MDDIQLANLVSEINVFPTFMEEYDTDVTNFLNGTASSCPHFLDIVSTISNDEAYSVAYALAWAGQGAAYGYLTDFLYEVSSIKRSTSILAETKSSYYAEADSIAIADSAYYSGNAAKIISFIQGSNPTQGIII